MDRREMHDKIETADGFIAALDQSGGSTPGALEAYGVPEGAYSGEEEMFDLVHRMRTRIMTSPAFDGDRILGAILFENTMARQVEGKSTARYLKEEKGIVPFLKVDQGLAAEEHGVRLMKPLTKLDGLLDRGVDAGVFGTKMRSVILRADEAGIAAIVDQQFEAAKRILARGLVPILEPEVDIGSPEKAACEEILKARILEGLNAMEGDGRVMLKLTLPSVDGHYDEVVAHPRVLRVVALSGGYSRDEANELLARNHGVVASFSRALLEGLTVQQTDEEFDRTLDASVASIFEASRT
ncbi:MAG TPA: fructose bisphosphate aldolase [Longimicrobiales bacterium]|nr:fructose bisphosphate aldolase [Longimicrobiales bacterium]